MQNKTLFFTLFFAVCSGLAHAQNVTADITARVKQFENDYNAASSVAVLAAHFTADAVMLDSDAKKTIGSDAIGHWHADFFQVGTAHLAIMVDEVVELPGGYAFCATHYVNKVTMKSDGVQGENKGVVTTIYKQENRVWKIWRHTLVQVPDGQ